MKKLTVHSVQALAAAAASMFAVPAVLAQDAPVARSAGGLEEITVTAMKREETLANTPFSVAAPSEDVLRSRPIGGTSAQATWREPGPWQASQETLTSDQVVA